jgi:hypothetical protein
MTDKGLTRREMLETGTAGFFGLLLAGLFGKVASSNDTYDTMRHLMGEWAGQEDWSAHIDQTSALEIRERHLRLQQAELAANPPHIITATEILEGQRSLSKAFNEEHQRLILERFHTLAKERGLT